MRSERISDHHHNIYRKFIFLFYLFHPRFDQKFKKASEKEYIAEPTGTCYNSENNVTFRDLFALNTSLQSSNTCVIITNEYRLRLMEPKSSLMLFECFYNRIILSSTLVSH